MFLDSIVQNRRYYQRNKMLSIIRFQENVSRYDVKKYTSYSMTTVLAMIDELIMQGFIYEEECDEVRVGRKPVWLRINPKGGYFIGVEFNGRKLHCDLLDFSGAVIYKNEVILNSDDSSEIIINKIIDNINYAREYLGSENEKVLGVGIGVPGYIDKTAGIAKRYSHFKDWKNIPIKRIVEERVGITCYIENNVNVMAFAYKWLYFNGDYEDFLFLSIRTGVRIVPIINNQLVLSNSGFSGELGHIQIASSHQMCACGKFGCLNTEVSDFVIASKIREGIKLGRFKEINEMVNGNLDEITVNIFTESILEGHADSLVLMKQVAMYLGKALGIAINILAPKTIIVYGELASLGDIFINEVRKNIEDLVLVENLKGFSISASKQGEDLGAIGAAALVMQEQFSFIEQTI